MTMDAMQWAFAALGALMVGISKTGITGLSILSVALFTHVFPSSKQASGLVLPLLIIGDFIAVASYRTHTQWRFVWKLMPWTTVGVVLGYFALGYISDRTARTMIGAIIVCLSALSYWRRYRTGQSDAAAATWHWSTAMILGMAAGFEGGPANQESCDLDGFALALGGRLGLERPRPDWSGA